MQKVTLKKKSKTNKHFKRFFSKINIIKYGGEPTSINTFRIYTTGIADDGNMEPSSYGYEWNAFVRERALQLIPVQYTNIEIVHHDILYNKRETATQKQRQIDFINRTVVQNDLSARRVTISVFLNSILHIDTTSPFIVFDYAHLFTYINPRTVSCKSHIIIDNTLLPRGSASIAKEYNGENLPRSFNIDNIKFVYLGYKANTDTRSNYIINDIDVFTVASNGRLHTYIDEYFMRKLPTEINESLIPADVKKILYDAVRANIKKEIGSERFNATFATYETLAWVAGIISSLDNRRIEFPSLIKNASEIAIKKIKSNIDKNADFWLKYK